MEVAGGTPSGGEMRSVSWHSKGMRVEMSSTSGPSSRWANEPTLPSGSDPWPAINLQSRAIVLYLPGKTEGNMK